MQESGVRCQVLIPVGPLSGRLAEVDGNVRFRDRAGEFWLQLKAASPKDLLWDIVPERDLADGPARNRWTRENLGLPSNTGTSEVVFAGPFPLFSGDATRRLRKELLSEEVQNNCEVKPRFVGRLFRGMVPR